MYIRGGCINHLCYFIKPDQVLYLGEALIEHSHEEIAPLRHTKCKTLFVSLEEELSSMQLTIDPKKVKA